MIKKGSNRVVWLVGRWALKFPRIVSWRGLLFALINNQVEVERQGPGYCPVVFWIPGGWLTVQARAEPLTDEEWEAFDALGFIQQNKLQGVEYYKRCSFGVVQGNIVAVDYGW
jgi:hypothetical protein